MCQRSGSIPSLVKLHCKGQQLRATGISLNNNCLDHGQSPLKQNLPNLRRPCSRLFSLYRPTNLHDTRLHALMSPSCPTGRIDKFGTDHRPGNTNSHKPTSPQSHPVQKLRGSGEGLQGHQGEIALEIVPLFGRASVVADPNREQW